MKNVTFFLSFFLIVLFFTWIGEGQTTSVQIVARKKSGLFGMGSPKAMEVSLSNQNKVTPLTSDNVNAGKYYYFLCKTVDDWTFDADFIKEDLPKLSIEQGEQKLHAVWKEEVSQEGSKTLNVGFPKTLQLHQPFMVKLDIGDETNEQELRIPEELWPGYSLIASMTSRADSLANLKQYKAAIQVYNRILLNSDLKIFPRFGNTRKLRTRQFGNHLDETFHSLVMVVSDPTLRAKEKMNQIDSFVLDFKYTVDSLPNPTLQVGASDTSVLSLIGIASEAIGRAKSFRDSLQVVYDNQNTSWIVEGNLLTESAFKYQNIIPILVDAFSSLASQDFSDTATALRYTLTDQMQAALTKYNVSEPYESFTRLCSDRFQRRQPIFPGDFLANLRADSLAFSEPYYSMLKAIDDFYRKDFVSSKNEIKNVFRACDDLELLPRFHELRVQLDIQLAQIPPVVRTQLREAKRAELNKDEEGTLDHYRQAMSSAPSFAFPAYALAEYYLNAGFPIRATPFFREAYERDKTFIPAYCEEYKYYQKSGLNNPMIQVLALALQNGNDYWEINYNLGLAYMGNSDPVKAAASLDHALALSPKSYLTVVKLGLAQQTMKNYPKAREYFNRAILLNPEKSDVIEGLLRKLDEEEKAAH